MRPYIDLYVNSKPVSDAFWERLISMHIVDNAGGESDSLAVVLDDRSNNIALPALGAELSPSIGVYSQVMSRWDFVTKGVFILDEIALSGPPHTVKLNCKSVDMRGSLKASRVHSWHDTTLGAVVTAIASRNGMTADIAPELAAIQIPHLDQADESDINFLRRLADQYDAVGKAGNGKAGIIYFHPGAQKRAAAGLVSTLALEPSENSSWTCTFSARERYRGVVACWYDVDGAKRRTVCVGVEEEPVRRLKHPFNTEAEAKAGAEAAFGRFGRGTGRLNMTFPVNPYVKADQIVDVPWIRDGIDGQWLVTRAEHKVDKSGGTTTIEAEQPDTEARV